MAPGLIEQGLTEPCLIEPCLIEPRLLEQGGTRPADLVFDPTFAC